MSVAEFLPSPNLDGNSVPKGASQTVEGMFSKAYGAQLTWSQLPIKERIARLKPLRSLLVKNRKRIADSILVPSRQDYRETIASEILPLADCVQWLGRRARKILEPRYSHRRFTPFWLGAVRSTVFRVPHGIVLIIGAGNYPLFLMGVQVLHALVAGNAVAIKPAPGAEQTSQILVELLIESGIPQELLVVLDSDIHAGEQAIEAGVDKVVLTGSSRTGRSVLKMLADSLTPATMELSGCDAVYVLPGADLIRVCDLLLFGMRLNGGATCMAPRRVFVPRKLSEVFHRLLSERLRSDYAKNWRTAVPASVHKRLWDAVEAAVRQGANIFSDSPRGSLPSVDRIEQAEHAQSSTVRIGPVVLTDVLPTMAICSMDLFAPLLLIVPVEDWSDALLADSKCPYALTASVYGPLEDAIRLAKYISAGTITINDTIVPTADPQIPFGGRGESGYGVTRGDEGLLEMTTPKVVSIRKGKWLPHAQVPQPVDEELLDGLLQLAHSGSWIDRFRGLQQTLQAAFKSRRQN